jgi:SEC-C motif-containing protein
MERAMNCPCGSDLDYGSCCRPVINGERPAATAEELMRARYSAYTQVEMDFLQASVHPDHRKDEDIEGARDWAEKSTWHGLEILATEGGGPQDQTGTVEFVASYSLDGHDKRYHEVASFSRSEGEWKFTEGRPAVQKPVVRSEPKTGRNDPCHCGSGKKYKRCCGS